MHKDRSSASDEQLARLGFVRYSGDVPFDELEFPKEPPNEDFEWAWDNPELRKQYAGKVIAIHQRTVWGVGKTFKKAVEDAETKPGCPPVSELVLVGMV